jgi:hypothetical protein
MAGWLRWQQALGTTPVATSDANRPGGCTRARRRCGCEQLDGGRTMAANFAGEQTTRWRCREGRKGEKVADAALNEHG